jgi:drug/metabolite transporter (DMT)-like permease
MKKAFFQIHMAVLLWGFTGVLGRAISLSAPVLVWYRMLLTALVLALIITLRKQWRPVHRKDMQRIISIGVLYAIHWVAFYAAVKFANASIAMICLATASVFTALLDPMLNKGKFNMLEIALSFVALGGVLLIYLLQPQDSALNKMTDLRLGVILGVVASIISAIFTVLNKPLAEKYEPRNLVFYEMGTGLLFLSLLAPFYLTQFPSEQLIPIGWDYLFIFLLSYCCTVWGQSLAMSALKGLSPFTITLSVNLEPVYGIILAFLIFKENEQLNWGFYLGMALIFASLFIQVALVIAKGRKQRKALAKLKSA